MFDEVKKALEEIRPILQADGGDVELIGVEDGVVRLKLIGACSGCAMAKMTLRMGIERRLREKVPQIKGVEEV
ncbi:MAG: NifU family protein [bacterium]|nr:NifU family protein [bacterium]